MTRRAASYDLQAERFPFPALAARAGSAPMGPEREAALACLMAARLANGSLAPAPLTPSVRADRAQRARGWLASLALSAPLRTAVVRVAELSGATNVQGLAPAVMGMAVAAARQLDDASRAELEKLAVRLEG
ncbi:MAG: hypothetical protein ACR2OG_17675 [Gemmatimonadaceae bacterium]